MSDHLTIGVVLLHFRRWPDVCGALDSLLSQTLKPDRVVVLDNDSGDGSSTSLRNGYPLLTVIDAPENGGYAAGMNLGVRHLGKCDAVLLMTHDCHLAPTALEQLVSRLQAAPEVGMVGPLLGDLRSPDQVWSAGGEILPGNWDFRHNRRPARIDAWSTLPASAVQWLDGACLLVRSTAWDASAGLDERFFLYIEDVEFSLRLQRLGWKTECVPQAVAWQSPGGRLSRYLLTRNRLLLLAHHAPTGSLIRELARSLRHMSLEAVTPGQRASSRQRLAGIRDAALGRLQKHHLGAGPS